MTAEAIQSAMRSITAEKDAEIERLRKKIRLIGGMCGAVRNESSILRDIAKMCSEEL